MAFALAPELPADLERPVVSQPGPREASFGTVAGTVSPGTHRVVVSVEGERLGEARVRGIRFELQVRLPPRDSTVEIRAEDALGNTALTTVGPVLGLSPDAGRVADRSLLDRRLARRLAPLTKRFGGVAAVYVQHLGTGAGWAWNARAHFPAASTVKTAIAIETMRILATRPPPGSRMDALLRAMLVESSNEAANELLTWIAGSPPGGALEVNRLLASLALHDSRMYDGFTAAAGAPEIPLRVERAPPVVGKRVSAYDLARLLRHLHQAAAGSGRLLRLPGSFEAADARHLLWILARSAEQGKLDRRTGPNVVVAQKGGWVSDARHAAGVLYGRFGAVVAVVLTWTGGEAGEPSDLLAARVARTALEVLREPPPAAEPRDSMPPRTRT